MTLTSLSPSSWVPDSEITGWKKVVARFQKFQNVLSSQTWFSWKLDTLNFRLKKESSESSKNLCSSEFFENGGMPPHPPKFRKSYQKHDGFLEFFGHFDIINQSQSKITYLGTSLKWYKIFLCNIMTSRYILSPQFASEWFWRQPTGISKGILRIPM